MCAWSVRTANVSHYLPVEFINVASPRCFCTSFSLVSGDRNRNTLTHTCCGALVSVWILIRMGRIRRGQNRMNRKKEIKFISACSGEKRQRQKRRKLVVSYERTEEKNQFDYVRRSTNSSLVCFYVFEFRNLYITIFYGFIGIH